MSRSLKKNPFTVLGKLLINSVTIAFFFFLTVATAQEEEASSPCVEPADKKALQLYEKGNDKKKYGKKERIIFLRQALELEPDYPEALYLLAEENIKTAKYEGTSFKPAEKYLQKLIEVCPEHSSYAYFYLGQIAYGSGQYTVAQKHLKKFLEDVDAIKKDEDYTLAENLVALSKEYAAIFEKPVPFNPQSLADVSTHEDEYLAIISPDNEMMFFTRRVLKKIMDQAWASDKPVETFTLSKRTGINKFETGIPLPKPFNMGDNYGGATITPDNKHLYVTICNPGKGGYNNCDIFTANFINGKWDTLVNLGTAVNTEDGWEAQPTISADGRTLYFAGARADSKGMDIYKSVKQPDGSWGQAERLPDNINSDKNEKSPFIHSDSQTLYFSSDGHTGVGGYDVFFVRADSAGNWKKPKNIGYPINSEEDEVGFFVSTNGKYGYFASNAIKEGKGGYDIYSFDLYKEARPEKVLFIKGEVKNQNGDVAQGATVQVKNAETKRAMRFDVDSADGQYVAIVAVKKDEDFVLTVKQTGMTPVSQLISSKQEDEKPLIINPEAKPIEVGKAYRLNNITYNTNSAKLTSESLVMLDELVDFLNENPTIKIAIHGHTDDVGNDADNLALSSDRAFSVMEYLQDNGIKGDRLNFKGFGKTRPLVPNTSAENRSQNRRTEFVILEK